MRTVTSEWVVVLRLMHTAQLPESELKIMEQLLSFSLGDYGDWARVGLDERRKVASISKKIANKKSPTVI